MKVENVQDRISAVNATLDNIGEQCDDLVKDIEARQEKMNLEMKTVLRQNSREKADMMISMENLTKRISVNDK